MRRSPRPKPKIIVRLFNNQGGQCAYCGKQMLLHPHDSNNPQAATKDHVIPRSRGGVSDVWNEVASCRSCNGAKGSSPLIDYLCKITNGKPEQHKMFYHPALKLDL